MKNAAKKVFQTLISTVITTATILSLASCVGQSKKDYKSVNLSRNDKNEIAKLLVNCGNLNYDSSDPKDEDTAILLTIGPIYGCWWMFQDGETEEKRESYYALDENQNYVKDPLKVFDPDNEEGVTGYSKYDGESVDQLIRNVFHMEPTHDTTPKVFDVELVLDSPDSTVKLKYYYHKGYYYAEEAYGICGMNGEGIVFDSIVSDGTDYHIQYTFKQQALSDGTDDEAWEDTSDITAYATVRKTAVDGKPCWSVVKLNKNRYFDFSPYNSGQSDDAWKKLYISYIRKYYKQNESSDYSLAYINDDDIPELIIDSGIMAINGAVCTVYDGKLQTMDVWPSGLSYIQEKNAFIIKSGRMDTYFDEVYKIEKGQFVVTAKGNYGLEDEEDYGEDREEAERHYKYYWNGKRVSKKQYNTNLEKAFDSSNAVVPYDNHYSAAQMIHILNNNLYAVYPSSENVSEE